MNTPAPRVRPPAKILRPVAKKLALVVAHPGLGKGMDVRMLGASVVVAIIGVAAAYLGFFTHHGMRLGPIPIPLSVVGPLLLLAGVVVGALSFRQTKCLKCQVPLTFNSAWFLLEDEQELLEAIDTDPQRIASLSMGNAAEPSVQVNVDACGKCEGIAVLDVDAHRAEGAQSLIAKRIVTDAHVKTLIAVITSRSEAHEANFEAQDE